MKYGTRLVLFLFFLLSSATICSQQVNTTYFMKNIQERNAYNPAFRPDQYFYLDLPVLPNLRTQVANTSVNLKDVFKVNDEGKTILFLDDPTGNLQQNFYNALHQNTGINIGLTVNLLNLGFRIKEKNYFTFGIAQKAYVIGNVPRDLFDLIINGTGYDQNRTFDLSRLGISSSVYTEYALGYTRDVNERLTWGVKAKFLMGQANVSTDFDDVKLATSDEQWQFQGEGAIRAAIPDMQYTFDEEGHVDKLDCDMKVKSFSDVMDLAYTSNWGLGADLGATYKLTDHLELSAALTDLGFIYWNQSAARFNLVNGYSFRGIYYDNINQSWENKRDEFETEIKDVFTKGNESGYTVWLPARLNLGAEYDFWNDHLGLGLLSSSMFYNKRIYPELTASANFRPNNWFSTSVSYSMMAGTYDAVGAGVQFRIAPFNFYIVLDKIPVHYSKDAIPSRTKFVNLQVGSVLEFGWADKIDSDRDGVRNKRDLCPDTRFGYLVDKNGCIVDADGDGVADNVDRCPDTPKGVKIDSVGCPLDTDKDGVADYLDKCPDTPKGFKVDAKGCPIDSDQDGVVDERDKCPDTPKGIKVDVNGCPIDSDQDGVPDHLDNCPDTPQGVRVNQNGCPIDSDQDGVPDYLDKCPEIKGTAKNYGCPEIKAETKQVFEKALHGVQFQTGKAVIKTSSYGILNEVADIMVQNPDYHLLINGHTDSQGSEASNLTLSQKRADAVKNYLGRKGVSADRITANGFGETQPIADNETAEGRALNRRVEFLVRSEE